jgi:hypothetical protein
LELWVERHNEGKIGRNRGDVTDEENGKWKRVKGEK